MAPGLQPNSIRWWQIFEKGGRVIFPAQGAAQTRRLFTFPTSPKTANYGAGTLLLASPEFSSNLLV